MICISWKYFIKCLSISVTPNSEKRHIYFETEISSDEIDNPAQLMHLMSIMLSGKNIFKLWSSEELF
ncbi:unnamed protein product [Larinioides sclopetarius]|uniref:Uncharacterized protein n=1 Tax=Larinioides sclopetarius TaxID=280406 RepID=A0AAV1Z3S4_9ARAC